MNKQKVIQQLEDLLERLKKETTHVISATQVNNVDHIEYAGDDIWVRRKRTGKFSIELNLELYDHELNELKSLD